MENLKFIEICNSSESMKEACERVQMPFSSFKRKALKLNCYKTNQFWNRGKTRFSDVRILSKYKNDDIFIQESKVSRSQIKNIIIKENLIDYICSECGLKEEWNRKLLTLQIDHINGLRNDNRLENLRFLCPNCHSQTSTFCVTNSKNSKRIEDIKIEDIKNSIENSVSITNVINNLGIRDTIKVRNKLKIIKKENNLEFKKQRIKERIIKERIRNFCKCGKEIQKNSKSCYNCYSFSIRQIERPSYEILLKEIEELGYCGTGRKYGVSDNAIRKWIK